MNTETRPAATAGRPATSESPDGIIDLAERGRSPEGQPLALDRRLFMQFMSFRHVAAATLAELCHESAAQAVVYQDVNDPLAVGVMAFCENPAYLIDKLQPLLRDERLAGMELREEFTMMGRTYSIGYEADLEEILLRRPARRVCDPQTPWAVYYPLRRSGQFEQQSREEQRKMLMEHGGIGQAFGKAGFATDIRLAGHGLNKDDNDFVVGLLGKDLFPLSAVVQRMRRTRQTAEFIQKMGPFFVGRAVWQPVLDGHAEIL